MIWPLAVESAALYPWELWNKISAESASASPGLRLTSVNDLGSMVSVSIVACLLLLTPLGISEVIGALCASEISPEASTASSQAYIAEVRPSLYCTPRP